MKFVQTIIAAALLALPFTLPAVATVTSASGLGSSRAAYKAVLAPEYRGVGEYDGILTMTIGSDGIVSGYFREDGGTRSSSVTGGLSGNRIWLDLGQSGLSHIEGTFDGKTISAGTYLGGQNYTFEATAL